MEFKARRFGVPVASWLRAHSLGATLSLYVRPGASTTSITGLHGDRLKIKIKAPPREGEANAELIRFLSQVLGIPVKQVHLLQGESSRQKTILAELSVEEILILMPY